MAAEWESPCFEVGGKERSFRVRTAELAGLTTSPLPPASQEVSPLPGGRIQKRSHPKDWSAAGSKWKDPCDYLSACCHCLNAELTAFIWGREKRKLISVGFACPLSPQLISPNRGMSYTGESCTSWRAPMPYVPELSVGTSLEGHLWQCREQLGVQ